MQDIKKNLPDWPDDVIDQWLLKLANQTGMSWPPSEPLTGRWKLLLTHPVSWWKDVTWTQEKRDCSFDKLSIDGRKTMNNMYDALVEGKDNGFGGDNSPARFQRQLKIVTTTGEFERPPVLFPIASGLSPLDGNHRIFAHHIALQLTEEDLAKYKVKRPDAIQTAWIASHKNGEDPG
ncbi:hypothetical protein GWG65_17390 [Bradyrhizobium sp. CSA207]|uniref:hypothetical protein n=1 Tax=Bradyrhizobium sp. CSA207 TaxID=2698826 RepID=UPI0023AFEE57|nr:hypothetical protein [Bradyrhizobium sp. CSA207]MDE5443193.1 hypothetical protein [Bradyrhizobium sp. CSA207]